MSTDSPISTRTDVSPLKYNLKVMERKMQAQTEWAELIRQQQTLAEQMIQKEKEKKMLQKMEMNETLGALINEKQNLKMTEESQARQQELQQSIARKQEYDQYLLKVKNDKEEMKKSLSSEYERKQWLKEEEKRKKIEYEKQLEQKMISDALDSLQREKLMKERKRNDFMQSVSALMREKEAQKRMEQERLNQERLEHIKLMEENARRLEKSKQNYQQFFQRVDERQNHLLQAHENRVAQVAKSKERQIDDFINKGIEDARRRAEEEEAFRQKRKQDQLREMGDNLRSKIYENQEEQWKQKMSYRTKVEDLMKQNIQMQEYDDQQKRKKANQANEYKTILEAQIKEAEDSKLKINTGMGMSDSERKFHLNQFSGLIPGVQSSRLDALVSPQMRSSRNIDFSSAGLKSPTGSQSYLNSYQVNVNGNNSSGSSLNNSLASPTSATNLKTDNYNPITNPIPNTIQNPYIIREYQREGYGSRNRFALIANRNI